ncbi:Hypothetical predicted protein [Paramuricea clavata]|uniref:Uncharacterized protein n=2 Tax=Paramuricea clavata TaxID=317549 RepID=A0A7D9E7A5_PARCT|nr:Hypothetical predicted protein [Paramuricea clavata]
MNNWGKRGDGRTIVISTSDITDAYDEITTWKKNVFLVPYGKIGRDFIDQITMHINDWNSGSENQHVSLKAVFVLLAVGLQKPNPKSKARDHQDALSKRLALWKDGEISKLIREGRIIQSRIGKFKGSNHPDKAKVFAKLVLEGQINSALRFLSETSNGGVLTLTDDVMTQLKQKHPEPQPPKLGSVLFGPLNDEIPESVYSQINGEIARQAALRTKGSGGPSGVDANGFRRMLACKCFKQSSTRLYEALARMTKTLCTQYIDPTTIEALIASRLIPLDKGEGAIKKGFTPNLSGTLEHTAQMTNIINQARINQRSVVITLLDLKNAFGEVHHNLIQSVLDYHHIPKDFADDAAVISGQDSENQHLLNRFSIWCQWSNMIVRVDKCLTFGIRKSLTKSIQYLPKLLINNELIPATKIGESFRCLGKYFDFSMSEKEHKQELITLMDDIMSEIDLKPLHPKNKLLLYSRYLLSKLSWHFTVTTLSKIWVSENMDSVVNKYVRKWLEIPISGTLSNVYLTSNKFGLNIYPPSIKFVQCQTVARNALKTSPNHSIKDLWKTTSESKNIQYDVYTSTKEVLKTFTSGQEDKLQNHLILQGSFFSNVIKFSLSKLNGIWSKSQSNLPKNIYNFTIRYINNSLPTRKNLTKWGILSNSDCSFCLNPETLLHVVAGCQTYLPRFTWRHDSVLNFIAQTLQPVNNSTLFVDLPGYKSPSIVTGDTFRPDLLLSINSDCLYILELSVGYESNLQTNVDRKRRRYEDLITQQKKQFKSVKFVNFSISSLGVFSKDCHSFLDMLTDLGLDKRHQYFAIRKIMSIAIRTTYYIFCCRDKDWLNPELLNI